jgi:hypothetical protein
MQDVSTSSTRRLAGRPSTLTVETTDRIVALVRGGNYVGTALGILGIPRSTYYGWWRRGDPDGDDPRDAVYRAFREDVERAQAVAEVALVAAMAREARERDWRVALKMLEKIYPEHWAPDRRRSDW